MNETIICVTQSPDKLSGTIVTSERTISYSFEGMICCNRYDVEEVRPLTEFVGKTIASMDLVELDDDEVSDCGGKGCFTIKCYTDVYTLYMWNHHNGYYVMNFDVLINGKPHWNLAF